MGTKPNTGGEDVTIENAIADARMEVEKRERLIAVGVHPSVVGRLVIRYTGRRICHVCWVAKQRNYGPGWIVKALENDWTFDRRRRRRR